MSYKAIFYYEPFGRELIIVVPATKRSDALKWIDSKIAEKDKCIPEGWSNWIIPNSQQSCIDYDDENIE